jgi:hypothetical protein
VGSDAVLVSVWGGEATDSAVAEVIFMAVTPFDTGLKSWRVPDDNIKSTTTLSFCPTTINKNSHSLEE